MRNCFRKATQWGLLLSILCFGIIIYGNLNIPDTVQVIKDDSEYLPPLFSIDHSNAQDSKQIRFLHSIAVKKSSFEHSKREYAYPSGKAFGIKLYTDGVMIVKTDSVPTKYGSVSPSKTAGLKEGDIILSINDEAIHSNKRTAELFIQSKGTPLHLKVLRDNLCFESDIKPVRSDLDQKFRVGLWVRDSSAGIGTITFYVPELSMFAGLGHAVCDVDTGRILPLSEGEAVSAIVKGSYKGRNGTPGELCGVFTNPSLGNIIGNNETGIYAHSESLTPNEDKIPIAMYYEVQEGPAEILAEVDESGTKKYQVQITKLFSNPDSKQKNLIVKVTDPELIRKTGGIVQGMSGCPIIQNGMLVGAVTHVFVNDPLQGFGIYAQTMMNEIHTLAKQEAS